MEMAIALSPPAIVSFVYCSLSILTPAVGGPVCTSMWSSRPFRSLSRYTTLLLSSLQ